ncbi:hypothetical protein F4804DRAFT_170549 [Jackrogersella minutella]|nr:hypothetical protein F4804DRAFT_170549 [Jackrogersella minutella]
MLDIMRGYLRIGKRKRTASKGHNEVEASMNLTQAVKPRKISGISGISTSEWVDSSGDVTATEHQETHEVAPGGVVSDFEITEDSSISTSVAQLITTIDSLNNELKQEHESRIKSENEARQLSNKLKNVQIKWKRTANKLDQILSRAQGFPQVTDEELKSMTRQLQYNIQNLAIQYFSEPLQYRSVDPMPPFEKHMPDNYRYYLKRPENYAVVIQAFIWRIITCKIFDRFRWAGYASEYFDGLWSCLLYGIPPEDQMTHASLQKLHTWRATTTGLALGSLFKEDLVTNVEQKEKIAAY